jgi:hypothetical protein
MARHRITLVRDDSFAGGSYSNEEWIEERRNGVVAGFSIERTEKLPDPPIVKKFEVEITFPPSSPPDKSDYAGMIHGSILRLADGRSSSFALWGRSVTVKEIS